MAMILVLIPSSISFYAFKVNWAQISMRAAIAIVLGFIACKRRRKASTEHIDSLAVGPLPEVTGVADSEFEYGMYGALKKLPEQTEDVSSGTGLPYSQSTAMANDHASRISERDIELGLEEGQKRDTPAVDVDVDPPVDPGIDTVEVGVPHDRARENDIQVGVTPESAMAPTAPSCEPPTAPSCEPPQNYIPLPPYPTIDFSQPPPSSISGDISGIDFGQWTVDGRDLEWMKLIGAGSFGRVFLALWNESPVAAKVLFEAGSVNPAANSENVTMSGAGGSSGSYITNATGQLPGSVNTGVAAAARSSSSLLSRLRQEAGIMSSLRHPNVVNFLGVCTWPASILTEYCSRGSLLDVLTAARQDPEKAQDLTWERRLALVRYLSQKLNMHCHPHDVLTPYFEFAAVLFYFRTNYPRTLSFLRWLYIYIYIYI